MKLLLPTILFTLLIQQSHAAVEPASVPAKVIQVKDGDTIQVKAEPWPGIEPKTSIRLARIDTPEMNGKCDKEVALAVKAKKYVERIITDRVTLKDVRYGKYAGRHIGEIITEKGVNLSDALIKKGYARKYDGGKRKGWCA